MPSGSSPRIWSIAFFTSATAPLMSSPMLNSTAVVLVPSAAVELILATPLIDRTAASIRWVICVSISVGAAPGWVIVTTTTGNSMSGCWLTSIRMKLTTPTSTSAANSTIGTIGFLIDQAERLRKFMSRLLRDQLGLHRLAIGEKRTCAQHHALAAAQPRLDRDALAREAPGDHAATHDLVVGTDDEDVISAIVRQHRRIRQARRDASARADLHRREPARTQLRRIGQRDPRLPQPRLRIDHRRKLPDAALERLCRADRGHRRRIADLELGQIVLVELGQHLEFAALGDAEQRGARAADHLPGLDGARQHEPVLGRDDVEPTVARAAFSHRRARDADLRDGRVARGLELVDVGLRDKAPVDELERPLEVVLRQRGVGL